MRGCGLPAIDVVPGPVAMQRAQPRDGDRGRGGIDRGIDKGI